MLRRHLRWIGLVSALAVLAGSCAAGASGNSSSEDPTISVPVRPNSSESAELFQGRYFDETVGVGEAVLTHFPEHYSDLKSLASDSELVFVGTLVGSRADVAETKMIYESGIEEQTMLV